MGRKSKTVIAVDIGTTKIAAIAAEIERNEVSIIGLSTQASYGVKKGIIINMDSTVDSIKAAMEELETLTDRDIHAAMVGTSGSHVKGFSASGAIPLSNREVKKNDIAHVLEAAKAVVIPTDREVVQILPQEFIVDDQDGISDPLGMSGVRLEAHVYIITGAVTAAQNIVRCLNRSGLKAQDMILHQLAAAEAVLSDDEKELGCAVIDIGGGTTDIAVFIRGSVHACSVLPLGGNQITSDIAIGLRTPLTEAENIKTKYGCAGSSGDDGILEVGSIGDGGVRTVSRKTMNRIVTARVEEIFELIRKELDAAGCLDSLNGGAVLTGGVSRMNGICDIARQKLDMPVRTGTPNGIYGIDDAVDPAHAAGIGLILYALKETPGLQAARQPHGPPWKFGDKMKQWFAEAF